MVNALVHSLAVGEVSQAALSRVDNEGLRLAAEIQENIFPRVIGAGLMRPATAYLGTTKSNVQARGIQFVKAVDDVASLEFSNLLLRIWLSDALLARVSVTSSVTNGDFSSSTGWTLATTGDATADINSTVAGSLVMYCQQRGGMASCVRSVATSSGGTEHALRIIVTSGPVVFRCGSTSGGDDYVTETELDTGEHSLAFTPSGTYYVYFSTRRRTKVVVDSVQVESAGNVEFTAPWTTAQLRQIRHAQDIGTDVVFLSHTSWQQRKIERRGTGRSWSLARYVTDDGPFTTTRTAKVKIKCNASEGSTTATSDAPLFRPEHVGALFRLTHDRLRGLWGLGAEGAFTDPVKITGGYFKESSTVIYNQRQVPYVLTDGATPWSGTLQVQRSLIGPEEGFANFPRTQFSSTGGITANGSYTAGDNEDGVTAWYRIGFPAGGYSSGSVNVDIDSVPGATGSGVFRVTAWNSATSVNVDVLKSMSDTAYTEDWQEGEWSDLRGWPSAVAFHDGRLFWLRKDKFWGSESGDYYAFNLDTVGDAASIQRAIAAGGTGHWLLSLQRLIFGTAGSEASARASSFDEALTNTNIGVKDASSQGVAAVSPVKIDGRAIYVQRSGTKLFQIVYEFERQDYGSSSLNRLNDTIGTGGVGGTASFVELAVQRQPETYVWAVRSDGVVPILLFDPGEKAVGWFPFITDGAAGVVESVWVLPGTEQDSVYMFVRRTINSTTVRYLEKVSKFSEALGLSTTKLGDSGILTAGPVSTVHAAHLVSTSGLVGWGTSGGVARPLTGLSCNSSGDIALGGTYTNVWVGLPYTGRYKSAKLAYGAKHGTALLQNKRVPIIGLLASQIHKDAVTYGRDFTTMYPALPTVKDGTSVPANTVHTVYDEIPISFGAGWDSDSRVCLKIAAGYPATLNGLVVGVETNES